MLPLQQKATVAKKKNRMGIFDFFVIAVLVLLTFAIAYPIYYTIIASFSDHQAVATGQVNLVPVGFQLTAYQAVFENDRIWQGYLNTIIYTVGGTAFNLFLTIPAAYAMSKKQMLGHGALTWYFLITMYFSGGMIPTYLLYKDLNLINNPLIMIISGGLSIYNMIVTRTYYQNSIPDSLYEAGRIDGSSEIGIFFKIALPLSMPIIAVMCLYYAVGHWNSYFNALLYLKDRWRYPLQLVLREVLLIGTGMRESTAEVVNSVDQLLLFETQQFAIIIVASLPVMILYPALQKYFMKGVMVGSIKG